MMAADEPKQLHMLFKKYWNSKDLDGMVSLYEEDAILAGQEGVAQGLDAIRAGYETFFAMGADIDFVGDGVSYELGDLALCHGHWKMTVGADVVAEAKTAEVARRGPDGKWRYILDNPFGGDILG
jgi:ketosteroid isomerase-like protein